MIKISGNGAAKLLDWVGLLKNSHVLVEVQSQALAECMITLIKEGFERERDPYGRRWARKQKPDGRKILHGESTRLRNGWHVRTARRRGFQVSPSVDYAGHHQAPRTGQGGRFNGGQLRPTRMQVPVPSLGLPARWRRDMTEVALAVAHQYYDSGKVGRSQRALLNAAKRRIARG